MIGYSVKKLKIGLRSYRVAQERISLFIMKQGSIIKQRTEKKNTNDTRET